jgi:hypothetical protein
MSAFGWVCPGYTKPEDGTVHGKDLKGHVHDWKLRGMTTAEPSPRVRLYEGSSESSVNGDGQTVTFLRATDGHSNLLYRCDGCEDFYVKYLAGVWTPSQLGLDV